MTDDTQGTHHRSAKHPDIPTHYATLWFPLDGGGEYARSFAVRFKKRVANAAGHISDRAFHGAYRQIYPPQL